MWNPLRTLRKRDSARLGELEEIVSDLSAQCERIQRTTDRIDARLRTRSNRANVAASSDTPDSPGGDYQSPDEHRHAVELVASPKGEALGRTVPPEVLRQRFRQKFGGA